MQKQFEKPIIFVSRCLGFEKCRYNGLILSTPYVEILKPLAEIINTCAEVDIGLGVPRDPIRLVEENDKIYLVQPNTGKEFSREMVDWSTTYFSKLEYIDGAIFKSRSPSCGIKDVKIYSPGEKGQVIRKDAGLFAKKAFELFPGAAIEDEGRLEDFDIRHHFYTHIFTSAWFRKIKKEASMKDLIQFHAENKYLFMTYNQSKMRLMGKVVANHDKLKIDTVFQQYETHLQDMFSKKARLASHINTLQHIYGYFKKKLSVEEKGFFEAYLNKYRNHKIPVIALLVLLKSWAVRFNEAYLLQQSYFEPYPEELFSVRDSGKVCSEKDRRY